MLLEEGTTFSWSRGSTCLLDSRFGSRTSWCVCQRESTSWTRPLAVWLSCLEWGRSRYSDDGGEIESLPGPALVREVLVGVVTAMALISVAPAALATASSTAGDAVPNFTESSACGTYGARGPLSPSTTLGTRIYGPFADFFGRSRNQVLSSTVFWTEPSGRTFTVHARNLSAFQDAAQRITAAATGYRVRSGEGWVWRNIAGNRQMSQHAVGNALDMNPAQNPYTTGPLITNMPAAYVQAWKDAGFCWGGDWRFTKDAMHYSWRGPAALGGTTPRLAPYAPLTAEASFTVKALDVPVAIPAGADLYAMADRRRDGADDLYGLVDAGGNWQVQVAGATSRFGVLGVRRTSGAAVGGVPILADANGDGRADLWHFNTSGTIAAVVYLDADRFRSVGMQVTTGAVWSADAELGMASFDYDDWLPDLYVIRTNSGTIEVYSAASGYQDRILDSTLPVAIGSDQIVLADRKNAGVAVDGTPDIWLVGSGNPASMRVIRYSLATGYSGAVENISTGMSVPVGASVLPGDYDGDGRIDLYVVDGERISVWLGSVPDRPVSSLGDWFTPDGPNTFDAGPFCVGDCDTIGYVDTSGSWRLAHQNEWAPEESNLFYGVPGDTPFMGDWDCDGVDTPGLYRRSDGYVYLRNSNTQGVADIKYFFGVAGDIPLAGDFNGDGCDTVSIYRPSEARFYVINRLGDGDSGLGTAEYSFLFGDAGDKPFVGDFDGNGVDEVGLHRESTGRVYFRFSLSTGVADQDFIYGDPGDVLLAGDWNGDGIDTPAIFRPSDGDWYIRLSNTQGVADHVIPFGLADRGFVPVAGRTDLQPPSGFTPLSECESCFGPTEYTPIEAE